MSGNWTNQHKNVLDDLLLVVSSLNMPLKSFRGMSEVEFYFYVMAATKKEERLSEMIGRHLGSLLDADTLKSIFFGGPTTEDTPPEEIADSVGIPKRTSPKGIFTPLALLINPEITEHMKERAKAVVDIRHEDSKPKAIPGIDIDQAELVKLQAMARRVDRLRKKQKYQRPEDDPSNAWALGIDGYQKED